MSRHRKSFLYITDPDANMKRSVTEKTTSYGQLTDSERKEVDRFVTDIDKNVRLEIGSGSNALLNHISRLLINDRNQQVSNVFIRNCYRKKYLCNALITAGIASLEPKAGVVFCTFLTGAYLVRLAESFYKRGSSKKYKKKTS